MALEEIAEVLKLDTGTVKALFRAISKLRLELRDLYVGSFIAGKTREEIMNIESKLSGHWTDDQLIAHLYGVGPDDGHLHDCRDCQSRLSVIEGRQKALRSSEEVASSCLRRSGARFTPN